VLIEREEKVLRWRLNVDPLGPTVSNVVGYQKTRVPGLHDSETA